MKTIVCYGDSNTWGHRSYRVKQTDPTLLRFPWGQRWTSLLQEKLADTCRVEEEGLNGRTTAFDDPLSDHRNGLKGIDPCMLVKYPADLVIVMLGTNDTKEYFHMPPYIIAKGARRIIERIQQGGYGPNGAAPQVLLISPIRLNPSVTEGWINGEFTEVSLATDAQLGRHYADVAREMGVHFMNAADYVMADEGDGVHMNAEGHRILAGKIYEKVQEILF